MRIFLKYFRFLGLASKSLTLSLVKSDPKKNIIEYFQRKSSTMFFRTSKEFDTGNTIFFQIKDFCVKINGTMLAM